jgi:ABC-type multidrug transport system fused ATPase/permease subunit
VAALPREKRGGELLAGISAAQVEFIDVSVRRGSRQVLKGVQALWRPGSRVALLGPSGGGKSTLAQLLQGVCHPELGRVCLDGVEVGALDLAHLRSLVAVVRSGDVFQGTILDNIALGRSDIGPAEVRAALAAVGLLEDVQALPKGLATSLRGLGAPLSLGQVRRLALARAIAVRPRLLVLDEVLDGLASAARDQAWQAVAAEHAPWTLVVLTHQREVAERCEEIWSLEQGRLERLSASDDGEGRAK